MTQLVEASAQQTRSTYDAASIVFVWSTVRLTEFGGTRSISGGGECA